MIPTQIYNNMIIQTLLQGQLPQHIGPSKLFFEIGGQTTATCNNHVSGQTAATCQCHCRSKIALARCHQQKKQFHNVILMVCLLVLQYFSECCTPIIIDSKPASKRGGEIHELGLRFFARTRMCKGTTELQLKRTMFIANLYINHQTIQCCLLLVMKLINQRFQRILFNKWCHQ